MRIIFFIAPTKPIAEVVIVLIALGRGLRMHAFDTSVWVGSECTRRSRWKFYGATVANEISLAKQLDQSVFAMARYGAGVAHCCSRVGVFIIRGRRIAGEARKYCLTQGS
jgi:hypothetical protein